MIALCLLGLLSLGSAALAQEEPALSAEVQALDRQLQTLGDLLDAAVRSGEIAQNPETMGPAIERYDEGLRVLAERGAPADRLALRRQTLVAARMGQVNGALSGGDVAGALTHADALLARLGQLRPEIGTNAGLDEVRAGLIRMALATADPQRARRWAGACAEDCAIEATREQARAVWMGEGLDALSGDVVTAGGSASPEAEEATDGPPRLLRWRIGVHWTVPAPGTASGGEAVSKSAADGGVVLAVSPTPAGCVDLGVAWDGWTVEGAFARRRTRFEVGWCPSLLLARRGRTVIGLRTSLGGGLSLGRTIYDGAADVRFVNLGLHARAEIPVRFGRVEVGPRVAWVPYGGGGDGIGRAALFGLGIAVGAPPREEDQR